MNLRESCGRGKKKADFTISSDSHLVVQLNILFKLAPDMTANMY